MRRLLLLVACLAALIACGLTFGVQHPDRVDAGQTFTVEISAGATDSGKATPGLCTGIPDGWTIDGPVRYTLKTPEPEVGEATRLPDGGSAIPIDPTLVWACWSTRTASFEKTATGAATLQVRVPKSAKGSYTLKWVVDYDISDGVDPSGAQSTAVFVGSPKQFALLHGKKATDELIATLDAPRRDLQTRRTSAEAWLAGTANLDSQSLHESANAWKKLREATAAAVVHKKTLKVAPDDKKRAKLAIKAANDELLLWTPLWSKLLTSSGAYIQQQLENVKNSDGTYDTIPPELNTTITSWLRAFDLVGSIVKLDPVLDAGLMEVMLVARFATPAVQADVAAISLRLARGKQAKALAYFLQASSFFAAEGKDGPNVRAACALAMKNAAGTDLAAGMKEACAP